METFPNRITLNLDNDSEVSVKGFIAPVELYWIQLPCGVGRVGESASRRARKAVRCVCFSGFSPARPRFCWRTLADRTKWCSGTAETTSPRSASEYA